MILSIPEQVAAALRKYEMVHNGSRVLVAFSGGADSLALLCALLTVKESWNIEIAAAHLDHGLRGEESKADADWAEAFCKESGVRFFRGYWAGYREVKPGQSPENAARKARYVFLEDTLLQWPGDVVALGHHLDDQAETVLIHLVNGSGMRGMGGMAPVRQPYIRPLIESKKEAILKYINDLGMTPRTDKTNEDQAYVRNRIRLAVIPVLEGVNPAFSDAVSRMAELARREDAYLDGIAQETLRMLGFPRRDQVTGAWVAGQGYDHQLGKLAGIDMEGDSKWALRLSCEGLLSTHPVIAHRALRIWIAELTGRESSDMATIERVYRLARDERIGALADAGGGFQVKKERGYLLLRAPEQKQKMDVNQRSMVTTVQDNSAGESRTSKSKADEAIIYPNSEVAGNLGSEAAGNLDSEAAGNRSSEAAWRTAFTQESEIPVVPGEMIQLYGGKVWFTVRWVDSTEEWGNTGTTGAQEAMYLDKLESGAAETQETTAFFDRYRYVCFTDEPMPVLRCRKAGDWIGMPYGRKKLKNIFREKSIPEEIRDSLPLLARGFQVLWIPGIAKGSGIKKQQGASQWENVESVAGMHEITCYIS